MEQMVIMGRYCGLHCSVSPNMVVILFNVALLMCWSGGLGVPAGQSVSSTASVGLWSDGANPSGRHGHGGPKHRTFIKYMETVYRGV